MWKFSKVKNKYQKAVSVSISVLLILQFILPTQVLAATKSWDFSTSSDYTFNNTKIEFSSGQAQLKATSAPVAWYNTAWGRRKAVTIDNTGNSNILTNYQVQISVTYDSDMQADFDDIRFTDSDGTTLIDYWLEIKTDSSSATFWVEVPIISASSNKIIYMYYGNSSVSSTSSGDNTFPFFDDFTGDGEESFYDMVRIDQKNILTNGRFFSNLLFDKDGHIVIDESNKTWLYYHYPQSGPWTTYAVQIDVDTLTVDETSYQVKTNDADGGTWANSHLVVKISDSLYVMFYTAQPSGNTVIRVATSTTPNGNFNQVSGFQITAQGGWESTSLETDEMWRKISEDDTNIFGWIGIEHMGGTYRIGWAKVQINKNTGDVTLIERYENNPLDSLMFAGDELAYGGGNIDSDFMVDGKYVMFYLSRDSADGIDYITRAISSNPMFDTIDEKEKIENGETLGETVVEKFQYYVRNGTLFLFYQNNAPTGGVSVRKYGPDQGGPSTIKWDIGSGVTATTSNGIVHIQGTTSGSTQNYIKSKTYTAGYNKAVRYRMKSSSTSRKSETGFLDSSQSNDGVDSMVWSDSKEYLHCEVGGSATEANYTYDTDWHTKELQRLQSSAKLIVDNIEKASVSSNCSTADFHIFLAGMKGTSGYNYDVMFDWIFTREYTSPEPSISIGSEVTLYDTGSPAVNPKSSVAQTFTSLSAFSETATKNGGQIKYQISNDSGTTWYWYNSGWTTATSGYAETNTAIDINLNIPTFPVGSGLFLFKAFLHSDGSQLVQLDSIDIAGVPLAPTIGTPTVLSSSSIRWNFTDNSDDETGFRIYDNTDTLATSSATTGLSYLDETGLSENTQYSGRYATTYNGYGNSASSSAASAKYTLADTPTNLSASSNSNSVTLSVDSIPNATSGSSGYYFSRSGGGNSGWIQTNSWTDTGLSCGHSYDYSVIYRNGDGTETSSISTTKSTSGCGGGGMPAGWSNLPIIPAGGFKVSVNSGVSTTTNRIINLNFNASSDVKKMAISLTGDFNDASQENYSATKQIDLCSKFGVIKNPTCPDGQYTVYIKFYTQFGVSSNVVTTKINLSTNPAKNPLPALPNLTSAIFTKPLSFGMSSNDVRRLQTLLATKPGIYPEGIITGYFGQLTKKAVQKFQLNYKVVSSKNDPGFGFVGPKTRAKLQEIFGNNF
ncbi:MAG: DUF2341 domain-containing protein [Candidatus Nomurabacteria bacterium]|nr:DUF2341 domain-containing protein [Candidatus Nomurabacteria bacterium]